MAERCLIAAPEYNHHSLGPHAGPTLASVLIRQFVPAGDTKVRVFFFGVDEKAEFLRQLATSLSHEKPPLETAVRWEEQDNQLPSAFYEACLMELKASDVLVVELSLPSLGTGYLCERAQAFGKRVVGICEKEFDGGGRGLIPSIPLLHYKDLTGIRHSLGAFLTRARDEQRT